MKNESKAKLTDDFVRRLKADRDDEHGKVVWDTDVKGFGVRVRATGKKTYFVRYRFGSIYRRINIGLSTAITAEKARKEAGKIVLESMAGKDRRATLLQKQDDARNTFGTIVTLYIAEKEKPTTAKRKPLRPRSLSEIRRHLEEHWEPFARRSVHDITRLDVSSRISAIAKERGAGAADHALSTLRALFTWGMGKGFAPHNPATATERPHHSDPRNRVLSDVEIAALWNVAGEGDFGSVVKLLLLTGQRRDEVGHMVRSELNLDQRVWDIPAARAKNGRATRVPLSDAAIEILAGVPERAGSDHVFGRGTKGFSGWGRAKADLDKRMLDHLRKATGDEKSKLEPFTIHDLRRTAATGMGQIGVLPHVIESVLNHISGFRSGVAGVYQLQSYEPEKRQALDRWAAHVEAVVTGKPASNVVALGAAS